MITVSSYSCLCPIHWSYVLSREWRCSLSSADRRCSNYILVINDYIAYKRVAYIRGMTVGYMHFSQTCVSPPSPSSRLSHFFSFPLSPSLPLKPFSQACSKKFLLKFEALENAWLNFDEIPFAWILPLIEAYLYCRSSINISLNTFNVELLRAWKSIQKDSSANLLLFLPKAN